MKISPDEVYARWAYSESLSGRRGGPDIESLLEKAQQKVPFDDLGAEERRLLTRKWEETRGTEFFKLGFDGIKAFQLTRWGARELAKVLVIPYFAQEVVGPSLARQGRTISFETWISTESIIPLPQGHARFALRRPGEIEPLTVGRINDKEVLLDGYHRAVGFWRRCVVEPNATLPVFVPR